MDYEKEYKEALEKAKAIYQGFYKPDTAAIIAETLQSVFPELKESEDEKIRKEIICFLRNIPNSNYTCEEMAAWLEKQGEPKQAWSEEDERIKNNLLSELTNLSVRKLIEKETKKKYAIWLKSLRPQSQWKPSDEQIEALDFAADCIVPAEFRFKRKVLKELLEQLKKL